MKKKITVALSGLNAIDSPGPGVGVIRCLKESSRFDVRVIGLAYENLEPGIYMGLTEKSYQIPYPSSGSEALYERIAQIKKSENIEIIIPNFDAELPSFIRLESRLKDLGITMVIPSEKNFNEREKDKLEEYGDRYKIPVPKSQHINSFKDLQIEADKLGYPIFVKGRYYEAYKAYSFEQASAYYTQLANKWGLPVVIQKMIPGEEFNICALGDGKGNLVGAVTMKKLFITNAGKAWAGITVYDDEFRDLAKTIVSATQWRGGMEIEMIMTPDGKPYVIEINPRFPAWVYLTAGCGQNLPDRLLSIAANEEPDSSLDYQTGKVFIRYAYDMVLGMDQFMSFSQKGEF